MRIRTGIRKGADSESPLDEDNEFDESIKAGKTQSKSKGNYASRHGGFYR